MATTSMTDFMDRTAAKIVFAANRGDSIDRIANKVGAAYSRVYDWVDRLEDQAILENTDNGIQISDHAFHREYDEMMAASNSRDPISQEDAYVIPHFAGMEFAYTENDAAYVWTHGGYQVARGHEDYPVFIEPRLPYPASSLTSRSPSNPTPRSSTTSFPRGVPVRSISNSGTVVRLPGRRLRRPFRGSGWCSRTPSGGTGSSYRGRITAFPSALRRIR